jgi:hypothetical protein
MPYRLLVPQLSPVADGVAAFLKREWGVRGLKVEKSVYPEIKPIPTFHAAMTDHHMLWVEVSNRAYPTHLDGIVADCMQQGLPVRLVVAVPSGLKGSTFHEDLSRARSKGVGVIAVDGNNGQILANALSLSLAGVHPIARAEFPAKFRYALAQAESRSGKGIQPRAAMTYTESSKTFRERLRRRPWLPDSGGLEPIRLASIRIHGIVLCRTL